MIILVAADGPEPGSMIAARFARAPWYQLVDTESNETTLLPAGAFDNHHEVILRAGLLGAVVLVAGRCGPGFIPQLIETNMALAHAHGIPVHEGVRRLLSGIIKVASATDLRRRLRGADVSGGAALRAGSARKPRTPFFAPVTPRGRHHVQQYAGRGT
jgi:predicted Fe-Mo cluster-binding NifX family protein